MENEYLKVKCLADILKSVYNHCTTVSNQQSDNMWKTRNILEIQYDKKPTTEVKSSEKESNKVSTSDHKREEIENESDLTTNLETPSEKPLEEVDNQTGHDVLHSREYDEHTLQGFVIYTRDDAVLVDSTNSCNASTMKGRSLVLSENHKPAESKNKNINRRIKFKIEDKLSVDERKSIGDIKKLLLQRNKDEVLKNIAFAVADEFGITQRERFVTYIKECAYVCWEMRLHDPPVHLKFLEVGDMDSIPFDGTAYRAYTHGGKLMEYVVWPPVYLHEDGPLLGKGVAQGK